MDVVRGRFAPSPTGPLHFGSLLTALGSYLHCKQQGGQWLVRMEDLDPPREETGAANCILETLAAHGMESDEEVLYQSQRSDLYEQALRQLNNQNLVYGCACSRKLLSDTFQDYSGIYPGLCRNKQLAKTNRNIRLLTNDKEITFADLAQGDYRQIIASEVGDFILKRRDGFYAYQLAVVVDDAAQHITEIVRGCDLLDNTPRQIYIQQLLAYPRPRYLHLPIATNSKHEKLSKQTRARALHSDKAGKNLFAALQFLNQRPPAHLVAATIPDILDWGTEHWSIQSLPQQQKSVNGEH
jgi:glutamyl-Q tRNA(Asp) synthetase